MKKEFLLITISFLIAGWMVSCKQHQSKAGNKETKTDTLATETDSIAIMQAFEHLKSDKVFLKDVGLENEKIFSWNEDITKVFQGDLNGDGKADALLAFTIEGRGGGNNYDMHYAIFLHEENQWKYTGQIDASILAEDRFYAIDTVENGVVRGNWLGNKDESLTPYAAQYILQNGQLVNTFTALHQTENEEREYLYVDKIFTPENISLPTTATLKDYEKLLGKGKITSPKENPECGTYYDEGTILYLDYPNLHFELNDKNKAALISIDLKNGFKLQTDKGTITENTKLEELKSIFHNKDSWMMLDEENGLKTFAIPDGAESDNQWHFDFDKNEKLVRLSLFIPC